MSGWPDHEGGGEQCGTDPRCGKTSHLRSKELNREVIYLT